MAQNEWDCSVYVLSGLAATTLLLALAGATNIVAWTWLAAIWATITVAIWVTGRR